MRNRLPDSPETGKCPWEGVGRADAGVRGIGGVSPRCQVKEASLELKDLQGVWWAVVSVWVGGRVGAAAGGLGGLQGG